MKWTLLAIATLAIGTSLTVPAVAIPISSSQEFFEEGQEQLEREIEKLSDNNSKKEEILQIDKSALPEISGCPSNLESSIREVFILVQPSRRQGDRDRENIILERVCQL